MLHPHLKLYKAAGRYIKVTMNVMVVLVGNGNVNIRDENILSAKKLKNTKKLTDPTLAYFFLHLRNKFVKIVTFGDKKN